MIQSTIRRHLSSQKVKFNILNNAGIITLNRPEKYNALDESMIDMIHGQIKLWKKDKNIKLINQEGNGKAFCAGGDVFAMVSNALKGDPEYAKRFMYREYRLNY